MGYSYRTAQYRYIEWILDDGTVRDQELFDYQTDPHEATNIAVFAANDALIMRLASQIRTPDETPGCIRLHGTEPEALPPGVWYNDWAEQHGLNGTNASRLADADGDGIPNLLEHAMGGNPNSPNDNPDWFRLHQASGFVSREALLFRFRRQRYSNAKGLSYQLKSTPNLQTDIWDPLEFEETGSTVIDSDLEDVTVRIEATNAQEFIRLHITEP